MAGNPDEAPLAMTHYEATQIVALRASLLSDGALAKVDVDRAAPFDPVLVAATELLGGLLDCVIVRQGRDVHVSRMEVPACLLNFVRVRAPPRKKSTSGKGP